MSPKDLREIRCRNPWCGKLLAKARAKGMVELKCPRCLAVTRVELADQE